MILLCIKWTSAICALYVSGPVHKWGLVNERRQKNSPLQWFMFVNIAWILHASCCGMVPTWFNYGRRTVIMIVRLLFTRDSGSKEQNNLMGTFQYLPFMKLVTGTSDMKVYKYIQYKLPFSSRVFKCRDVFLVNISVKHTFLNFLKMTFFSCTDRSIHVLTLKLTSPTWYRSEAALCA